MLLFFYPINIISNYLMILVLPSTQSGPDCQCQKVNQLEALAFRHQFFEGFL